MNEYLKKLRERFETMQKSVGEVQTRCATESRDMTEAEATLVRGQIEAMGPLAEEIRVLTEQANREADVADMAAELQAREDKRASSTEAKDRDPGHYRSVTEGGQHSFFGDLYRSNALGDEAAKARLAEHNRALTSGGEGVGLVAPKWLSDQYADLQRQGRRLADAVTNVPLGNDPRPITIPKQTVGTDTEITEQANENDPVEDDDSFDTDVSTVTPKPTAGIQIVSRQMLDMASPAVDGLIYGDMIAAYNLKIEKKVGAAMIAAATNVTTFATNAAFSADDAFLDALIDAEVAILDARKMPADIVAMGNVRYGFILKLKDADGRPLVGALNPMNAFGSGNAAAGAGEGQIEGLRAIPTDGVSVGSFPDKILVARAKDTLLFESNMMRFRYEQPLGPESIKLGIWAYSAVFCRFAGSQRTLTITAAS